MRECPCCVYQKNADPGNWVVLVMPDLSVMRICRDCINAMWLVRNEEYAAQQAEGPPIPLPGS
jgi:hypothetical protein